MGMTVSLSTRSAAGRRTLLVAVAVVVIALLAVLALALARGRPEERGALAGGRAPAFNLLTFQGGRFNLAEHAGGPVLVYFWASWCLPCRDEAPIIQRLAAEYEDRGYAFVGVNIWDAEKDARAFVQQYGLTFATVADQKGEVYLDFGVERLPTAIMLGPGLQVERRFLGQLREPELRALLDGVRPVDGVRPAGAGQRG